MSEFISQFHFMRPWFFLTLLPAIALTWALLRQQYRAVQWQSFIAPHLLNYLVDGEANKVKRVPLFALLALWSLATVALAGPAWKKLPQPVHKETSALVIIWDLSPSMKATDLSPSRVVRSRLKLFDLLKSRQEGVTALISYSGEAHIVTPLTDDTDTISSLLAGLHPDIMPVSGSNTEMALEMAMQLLNDGGIQRGDILFLTDGIAEEAQAELAAMAKNSAHRIVVWGVGTAEGAPIPGKNSGFIKNRQGDIVIAKLDEKGLSDAASAMGGVYLPFTNNDFDLRSFQNLTSRTLSEINRESQRTFDTWYEHGPYLLLLVLPFAAFAFRRGWLLGLCCLSIVVPEQSEAMSWEELWLNKDQQAYKDLQRGDAESAAEKFEDKQWQGVADYKAQNYDRALENFSSQEDAEALFNQGNALTHMDDYPKAKAAYNRALELKPDFQAAKDNLDIVEQLEKLQQQSQQDQQQDQQNQDQNQEGSSQQNNQQSQQSDSSENSNQQNQQSDSQQNSDQQNSGEQNQQANNRQQQNQQEQNQEQNDDAQAGKKHQEMSEEQQQALEQQYGKQGQEEQGEQGDEGEQQKQEQQLAQQQKQDTGEENGEQQVQSVASAQPEERSEENQALDQWLRKVPDDPSGLLRNKFKYESRERQLKMRNNTLRRPGVSEERL